MKWYFLWTLPGSKKQNKMRKGSFIFQKQKEAIPLGKGHHKKTTKNSLFQDWSKETCDAKQTGSATTEMEMIN